VDLPTLAALAGAAAVVAAVGALALAGRRGGFRDFEPGPLALILAAVAQARGLDVSELRPGDRAWRDAAEREALAAALAARGVALDLPSLPTVRDVVGAAAPLLERRPRVHH